MNRRDLIRSAVIRTNPYWPFSNINKLPYYVGIRAFVQLCKAHPEIKSVYLRSGLVERQWVPALSDIDLTVITDSRLALNTEFSFLRSFWNGFTKLKTVFPMFGEIEILNDRNIASWTRFGLPGYGARNWKLIYGIETVEYNYVPQPARLSMDCINYALHFMYWYSRGHFEQRFFAQEETAYLLVRDLHRLASKIYRCLNHISSRGLDADAQESRSDHPDELCAGVIKALERAAARINASEPPAEASDDDPAWEARFADEYHKPVKSEVIDVSSFAPWHDAIESVTLDFNNRVYLILRNNLDVSVIVSCISAIRQALGRSGVVVSVVTSNLFEYMVRYYQPFEYVHLMRHRKVAFGKDMLLDIAPPRKHAFIDFLLGQVPNALTYPQSQKVFSPQEASGFPLGEIESTFERMLFLNLYLEHGFIAPAADIVHSECERQYSEQSQALRRLGESRNAGPNQERFETLRRMANEIHHRVKAVVLFAPQ